MQLWTHEEWRAHASSWRYLWHCQRWHYSSVLKRIKVAILVLALYALIIRWFNDQLGGALSVPSSTLSLQVASIGLLLVFRTNQVSGRVTEARALWGALHRHCSTIGEPNEPQDVTNPYATPQPFTPTTHKPSKDLPNPRDPVQRYTNPPTLPQALMCPHKP